MASSSAPADSSVAFAKLRNSRAEPLARASRRKKLAWSLLVVVVLLGVVLAGIVVAQQRGWIPLGSSWPTVPEFIQSQTEVRLASVTVETGRSADDTVVTTGSERDKRTEVTQGLSGGERVVIAPAGLESGQLVRIAQ